jgi:hypothetical protein
LILVPMRATSGHAPLALESPREERGHFAA